MRSTTIYLLSAMLLAVLVACSDNPTGPNGSSKDPRLYTWSVDTLAGPGSLQTFMWDLWGSAPNNIYVAGHNDASPEMYHYDGNLWWPVGLPPLTGSPSFNDLHGFGEDNIWAVGEGARTNLNPPPTTLHTGFVLHYDGSGWREQAVPLPDSNGTNLYAVGGTSSSNLFVGGRNGLMFHYDGTRWQPSELPAEVLGHVGYDYGPIAIEGNPERGEVFMLYKASSLDRYLLKHSGRGWEILKNMYLNTIYADLWMSPWGKLYAAVTGDVQVWNGTDWEHVLLEASEARTNGFQATGIHGTSEDNFFVVGDLGIFHYNGMDRFPYEGLTLPGEVLDVDVWTFKGEVFVMTADVSAYPWVTLVYHGQ